MRIPRGPRPTTRRHRTPLVPPAPPPRRAPGGGTFCAMCWGAGRILVAARNGEGRIPVTCGTCAGTGTA